MADPAEQGEPVTFGEVVNAATPRLRPGVSKQDFLNSLRHAARTGGHVPGGAAPDISMPVVTDLSGKGVHPSVMKAVMGGATSLEEIGEAMASSRMLPCPQCSTHHRPGDLCAPPPSVRNLEAPPVAPLPSDPFAGRDVMAGTGLHEMFEDMLAGGFTEDQATSILGKMLAAYGRDGD